MKLPTRAALIALLGDVSLYLLLASSIPTLFSDFLSFVPAEYRAKITAAGFVAGALLKGVQRLTEWVQGLEDRKAIEATHEAATGEARTTKEISEW